MTSQPTPEARELELVGKLEFRIAAANTDKKLEELLDKFLAPLLLKLGSDSIAVRNKVIAVCQHINKRIMPPQEIKLPVKKLLAQFKGHADVPLIRHFDIQYIQKGISKVPASERLELLPILIQGIAADFAKSPQHASQLFHLILRLFPHFKLPPRGSKEDDELRALLQLGPEDAAFLSQWFGKLILLTVSRINTAAGAAPRCPGVSVEEYKFLTLFGNPEAWDPTSASGLNITETKSLVARLLSSGMFTDQEKFLPALFASADTNSRVSDVGDDIMKRVSQNQDLENPQLVEQLLQLYFDSDNSEGALAVKVPLRIKILGILSKSVTSTKYPLQISKLVEEGVFSAEHDFAHRTTAGREASKFRSAIFSFVNFVARRGSEADLAQVAEGLVGNLRGFVQDQGWPTPDFGQDLELRGYAYETIGLLAKAAPEKLLLEPSLNLLDWLFRSLREDTSGKDVAVSIEEGLSSVLGAFQKPFDETVRSKFREVLLQYSALDKQEFGNISRSTRYVATRFANRCLPYNDVLARWVDIVAVSGGSQERHEVLEEGRKGLDPFWFAMQNSAPGSATQHEELAFPDFDELVNFIFVRVMEDDEAMDVDEENIVTITRRFQQQHAGSVPSVIEFCTQVAMQAALSEPDISISDREPTEDWGRKLETRMATDHHARQAFRAFAANPHHSRSLAILLRVCFERLTKDALSDLGGIGETFVRLCALSSDSEDCWRHASLLQDFRALEASILANNPSRRLSAGHVYGMIASHPDCPPEAVQKSTNRLLEKLGLWKMAVGAEINQASGAIVALGYYFSRAYWRGSGVAFNKALAQDVHRLLETAVTILDDSRDATLKTAVFSCIDQLSLYHVLMPSTISDITSFPKLIDHVYGSAKTGATNAIVTLGHLAMVTSETTDYTYVFDKLYELHEIRQPEAQFSVGEAFSCFALGWNSKALTAELDILHPDQPRNLWDGRLMTPAGISRDGDFNAFNAVMDKALKGCFQTKPALKKAAVIWLLCLLQYCGHYHEMQDYLRQCQNAFKNCLSDRDEIVQESASRGLGLVYEKGDRNLKDNLVRDLVGSFSDNKPKMNGTVDQDTQLFEPGALPTGDGKSITTYKDILSLASEVGDSSLVYRFMSLASNNSIWSSRAAFGRFGLSNIFSDSSVSGYLSENPKLYPKLYRYRFDPNPNVQRSMNDIWNALVKDSSATIDKYFDAIMSDLLVSILGKEWRVRQASCAAIADLVQGRKMEKYEKYLDQIWDKCFKVLDDIKESVRAAAASLARVLTSILTRSLEAGDASAKNASAMLSRVLPFLLSPSGLESSAEEVRLFAVRTLLEIVKKSNAATLNPHSPLLVERLLGLLSTLEPEAVNYIHLNASKYNLTEQKIDDMRLQSVRSSPLTESIERCLDLADADTMVKLVAAVEAAIKSAVGLPSKVGCARVLVSLSTRHNLLFKPYADAFLKLVLKYVRDRNDTVASSYAASAGYIARLASDAQILSTLSFVQSHLYFGAEDDKSRLTAGDILLSLSKNASDRFASLAADILPFVFLAKHDSNAQVKKLFSETWEDNVAGSRAVLLYLKEIVALADVHLESQKWVLKHTAAKTVADAVGAITTAPSETIEKANAETIWPALDKAMGGKTWEGKEIVLDAFVRFVERGNALWSAEQKVAKQIEKVAVREAKRQNKAYRPFALEALGKICRARTDLELLGTAVEIVGNVLEELLGKEGDDGEKMDVDAGDVLKDVALSERTLSACVTCLLDSPNPEKLSPAELSSRLSSIFPLVLKANSTHAKDVHLATFNAVKLLFERLPTDLPVLEPKAKEALEGVLFDVSFEGLPEAMRMKRAEALVAVGKAKEYGWVIERVKPEVEGAERSAGVRAVLAKVGKE